MYEKYAELLKQTGKTNYQVSKDTGISQTSLSNWKRGEHCLNLQNLHTLSIYFGVPMEYFLVDGEKVNNAQVKT